MALQWAMMLADGEERDPPGEAPGASAGAPLGPAPANPAEMGFWEHLRAYRDALEDPGFGTDLVPGQAAMGGMAGGLASLHALAAERFEERAAGLAAKADWVDAYESGAYGEPLVNGIMLTVLMTTTLGFSLVVLTRMPRVGVAFLIVTLALNVLFVRMWRRPPYKYEGDYRKRWDDASAQAQGRAEQARQASISALTTPH
jgi:hypothetical protein